MALPQEILVLLAVTVATVALVVPAVRAARD
jgi:hypothetical protein